MLTSCAHTHSHTFTLYFSEPPVITLSGYDIMPVLKAIPVELLLFAFITLVLRTVENETQSRKAIQFFSIFPVFQERNPAKCPIYTQLGRSVIKAARELGELKDCVRSVPAG